MAGGHKSNKTIIVCSSSDASSIRTYAKHPGLYNHLSFIWCILKLCLVNNLALFGQYLSFVLCILKLCLVITKPSV